MADSRRQDQRLADELEKATDELYRVQQQWGAIMAGYRKMGKPTGARNAFMGTRTAKVGDALTAKVIEDFDNAFDKLDRLGILTRPMMTRLADLVNDLESTANAMHSIQNAHEKTRRRFRQAGGTDKQWNRLTNGRSHYEHFEKVALAEITKEHQDVNLTDHLFNSTVTKVGALIRKIVSALK